MTEQFDYLPCRHLGLFDDASVIRSMPTQSHRCYAQKPPASIDLDYQQSTCLTSRHAACQFCQAAGGGVTAQNFAAAGTGSSPVAAPQRESARARKRRRNLGVSSIVAFLLVGAVGLLLYTYGMDFMRMPELTDIPMVQFQPPTPDVTDTPWPSPTPTDAPTATETPVPAADDALVEAPTDAQVAPGGDVIQISDDAAAADATVTATFTPVFEDEELTIRPRAGEAGW